MSNPRKMFRPDPAIRPTPADIAKLVSGDLLEAESAPAQIGALVTLDQATPEEMSFFASEKYLKTARASAAGLLLAPKNSGLTGRPRIEVSNVWLAVTKVLNLLYPDPRPAAGVHASAVVETGVELGKDVSIGPFCHIGAGSKIGDRVVIGSNCSIAPGSVIGADSRFYSNVSLQGIVQIGRRVILHSCVVIGADGFRFEMGPAGLLKIPQIGAVIIEDEVEIGASTTVDRPFLHETRIGWGTKIDNQVQIAHNCIVGKLCVIAGSAGLAGSVTMGDGCMVGGGTCLSPGITIGNGCKVGGMTGVLSDLPAGSIVMGTPERNLRDFFKEMALSKRLPELFQRVRKLEQPAKSDSD